MNTRTGRTKQAKAKKLSTSYVYEVSVLGYTWEGFESTYEYKFDHTPTLTEISQKAGDFESITDCQIEQFANIQYTDGYRVIRHVLKPWTNDDSEQKYFEANNC